AALAAHAEGAIRLHEGDPRAALVSLEAAAKMWNEVDAPYEAARVRALVAVACDRLGDADARRMELAAARRAFARLGSRPDVERIDAMASPRPAGSAAPGLTPREVQVLQLVATGKTNRAIAGALDISEKTVARHVSNIFTKLDLSSRAAATAYAYEHALL